MISEACCNEFGGIYNGKPGDQTDKEYAIRAWHQYYDGGWNYILRYPDAAVRDCIADLAEKAAKNNNIGYEMNDIKPNNTRESFWNELKKVNYQPDKITTKCEADCSSSTSSIVKATGCLLDVTALKNLAYNYATFTMVDPFVNAGFKLLGDKKYLTSDKYLLRGDILLNVQNHVAINLTDGIKSKGTSAHQSVFWFATIIKKTGWYKNASYTSSYVDNKKKELSVGTHIGVCAKDPVKSSIGGSEKYYYIYTNGKYGYVKNTDVKAISIKEESKKKGLDDKVPKFDTSVKKTGKVTADVLNVRSGAGTNNSIITTIKYGTTVNIYGTATANKEKWYYIKLSNGKYGYVHSAYVKV